MNFFYKIIFLLSLLIPSVAQAQFYVTGDDPGKLKWKFIDTDNFRVIYPQGADSLAREYGYKLEKYRIPVSRSTGYVAGQGDGKLMPVVLHAYNGANGSVAWAPKRMDLFTLPTAYDPEPLPWSTMLSVHEGRHVTQMQFGMTNNQKPFTYAFGEMWNILVSLVYPGLYGIEGDAVIAETALTPSGRGRTADFLNYYRIAFDQGDYRTWDRWQFGSQKHYTPDHYALGYMTFGTVRYLYDYPMLMKDGYNMASKKILNLSPFISLIKEKSGKNFKKEIFPEVRDTMQAIWSRDAQVRAPFIYSEEVTKPSEVYTNYSHTTILGNDIYTIKSGYQHTPTLIKIDDQGNETRIKSMSYDMSDLVPFGNSLIWSEDIPDERWSMKTSSVIRSYNIHNKSKQSISNNKNLLYNPAIRSDTIGTVDYSLFGEDYSISYNNGTKNTLIKFASKEFLVNSEGEVGTTGRQIAAVQYETNGETAIRMSAGSAGHEGSHPSPDSLQLVEIAFINNKLYASAISDNGFGIYSYDGKWDIILEPQPVKIKDFKACGNELMFTSDRTGVNELYHFNPVTGELRQKTVTKYGAEDFVYGDNGYLYYSAPTLNGMRMYRTPVDSLINRKVDYTEKYKYIIADCLSEQEKQLALNRGEKVAVDDDIQVNFTEPKRYRKAAHMFNIHSWAPVYVNVDNIMNMSYDYIFQAASLGASAIMQNRLATGVGEFGYSAHKDPYNRSKWRHSGHFKFTYSGLYPVIEAKIDFNDRAARQFNVTAVQRSKGTGVSLSSKELNAPYFEGKLSAYVPFNFSSGGWYKGLIPKISYKITNDMFNTSISVLKEDEIGLYPGNPPFIGATDGKNSFRHYLTGSVRAYTTLSTPNSAVYPRWGIGAEIGATSGLESADILSPVGYAYLYGYVPGFTREQGLKLSVMHQQQLSSKAIFGQPAVQVLPRGLTSTPSLASYMSIYNPAITKLSADYAIPIYIGDLSIGGGFIYIKRLCLTPHVDYTRAGKTDLLSVGSAFTFDLNGIIWIGWPVSVGATYSYSGLADYNLVKSQSGLDMDPHHVGFVFNVSF